MITRLSYAEVDKSAYLSLTVKFIHFMAPSALFFVFTAFIPLLSYLFREPYIFLGLRNLILTLWNKNFKVNWENVIILQKSLQSTEFLHGFFQRGKTLKPIAMRTSLVLLIFPLFWTKILELASGLRGVPHYYAKTFCHDPLRS